MSLPPLFKHQETGVRWLMERPYGMLGDSMRLGKTRQVIEAAQRLFLAGQIDRVIVVAPAPVRDEWYDPDFGQLVRYRREDVTFRVTKYQARSQTWAAPDVKREAKATVASATPRPALLWTVTNYELIRRDERLLPLLEFAGQRTLLVLDESLAVKSPTAKQTKACWKLRVKCGRVWALNGTPEGDNPGDAFAQYQVLSTDILGCKNWYQFRSRYGILGGFKGKQVVAWTNLSDLRAKTSPHTLRRTLDEVFDLPPALDPVMITATLSEDSWRVYQEMKKDAIAWLDDNNSVSAAQAGVKVMRLSQITSGFLGGVSTGEGEPEEMRPVGTEKLDAYLAWLEERLHEDPSFKVVTWCRFRAEAEGIYKALETWRPERALLYGGQHQDERTRALRLLSPSTTVAGPVVVVGTAKTGGFGLNFAAASTMVYVSNDYSLVTRRQSSARILGPDQKRPAAYFDVVATGPDGQKTVDHSVLKALRKKEDVSSWTAGDWARALMEE